MRLFLVRHGETVDNVAGIYAGTRDSPLTAHGVLQARRLGAHLASLGRVRHVYASDLQRAVQTAQAVVDAQQHVPPPPPQPASPPIQLGDGPTVDGEVSPPLRVLQLRDLRERDFGAAEGTRFAAGVRGSRAGAETWDEMRVRAERVVRGHLVPILEDQSGGNTRGAVVVVAHGLILDALLRVLLALFGSGGAAAQMGEKRTAVWSNTGYVEAVVEVCPSLAVTTELGDGDLTKGEAGEAVVVSGDRTPVPALPHQKSRISLSVVGVNVLKHLEGLKKTRGGIGSSQFDKRQRTVDSFFKPAAKKPRVDPKPEQG